MGIPLNTESLTTHQVQELLLKTHSALVQATNEQQIIAATALCADMQAYLRLFYLESDASGHPLTARMVASWKDGSLWEDDPLHDREFTPESCSLLSQLETERDPVYFIEDTAASDVDLMHHCFADVCSLVAIKLVGIAHIEQPSQWHGIVCITWSTPHRFTQHEKYIFASIWETISVVVSNHRLRLEALENVVRLKEMDRLKSMFLQSVSHELRTPLTAVITTTGGILAGADGDVSDDLRTDIEMIHQAGEHLLSIISDLLDMASIEAGKMKLYPQPTDIAVLVLDAVRTIGPLAAAKGLNMAVDLAQKLPLVNADRTRIQQVLLNLLSNAVKFTLSGAIRVAAHQNQTAVIISVSDTGIGIRPEDHTAIFKRFHRIDNLAARTSGGTGLGLPISKHLIEQHGGKLWLKSDLGKGSTFFVSLPLSRGDNEAPVR